MCDCLAWQPEWRVAARRAGVKPGVVFAVFMALRHGGPYPLTARAIAEGLGFKPMQVALILSALQEAGIIDEDLKPVGDWALSRDTSQSQRDSVTVTDLELRRAADRKRQTECRDRKKAREAAALAALDQTPALVSFEEADDNVTVTVTDPLEEERISLPPSERAGGRDEKVNRREQLLNSALELMRARMRPAHYAKFVEQLTEHGRYERFLERGTGVLPQPLKEALEKAFKIVQDQRREAISERPKVYREPEFPLPITFKRSA